MIPAIKARRLTWASGLLVLVGCVGIGGEPLKYEDLVHPTDHERLLLSAAEESIIRECVNSSGEFSTEFPALPVAADPAFEPWDRRSYLPWGWDEVKRAQTDGYGLVRSLEFNEKLEAITTARQEVYEAWFSSLPTDERERVEPIVDGSGTEIVHFKGPANIVLEAPRDGCRTEARIDLYESIENHLLFRTHRIRIGDGGLIEVNEDAQYMEAMEEWSVCMRQRGHSVETPLDAYGLVFADEPDQIDMELERFIATDDARCNVGTELRAAGDEALERVRRRMVNGLKATNSEAQDILCAALERAAMVLDRTFTHSSSSCA